MRIDYSNVKSALILPGRPGPGTNGAWSRCLFGVDPATEPGEDAEQCEIRS
jgi:hypothetical protein